MMDYEIIKEMIEDLLVEHRIEAQVDYELVEFEEDYSYSSYTFYYSILLVELLSADAISYIYETVDKMVKTYFGNEYGVNLHWH